MAGKRARKGNRHGFFLFHYYPMCAFSYVRNCMSHCICSTLHEPIPPVLVTLSVQNSGKKKIKLTRSFYIYIFPNNRPVILEEKKICWVGGLLVANGVQEFPKAAGLAKADYVTVRSCSPTFWPQWRSFPRGDQAARAQWKRSRLMVYAAVSAIERNIVTYSASCRRSSFPFFASHVRPREPSPFPMLKGKAIR